MGIHCVDVVENLSITISLTCKTQALATSYALHAIDNLLSHLDKKLYHRKSGIFTSSGFYNVPLSLGYLHDIKHSGQSLASPLQFPYIIANAMPTSLARHFGFKSFAIALGHDHLAYLDCLYRGMQSLKASRCEQAFCVGVSERSELVLNVFAGLDYPRPLKDMALASIITQHAISPKSVRIFDAGYFHFCELAVKRAGLMKFHGINDENVISVFLNEGQVVECASDSELSGGEVLRAVACVPIWEAYKRLRDATIIKYLILVNQMDGRCGYLIIGNDGGK